MNSCNCFEPNYTKKKWRHELKFHGDEQDRGSEAWKDLLSLIDEAVEDKREVFDPKSEIGASAWSTIETLPAEIEKLKHVKHLMLYGSNLTWIPPEIGNMDALEEFTPYTSYRLHWLPFEITKCKNLKRSTVSTRALYGNYKYRSPFPLLKGNPSHPYQNRAVCSVCNAPATKTALNQVWLSLKVATDVLPLLVHTCSSDCLQSLPVGAEGYLEKPHKGGLGLAQPEKEW